MLHSVKDPTSRLVRWRLKLAEYEYEVINKAGKTNVNADALSRNPVKEHTISLINNENTDNEEIQTMKQIARYLMHRLNTK
jgi:hypothetical protein